MAIYNHFLVTRTRIQQETGTYTVPLNTLTQVAAIKDALPDGPAGDGASLGLVDDPTAPALIGTSTNNTTATESAACVYTLPPEYVAGGTITIRGHAKVTELANADETFTAIVAALDGAGTIGAPICATVAALTNTWEDHDLVVTPTGLVAGDQLLIRLYLKRDDQGGATAGYATLGKLQMLLAIKG